MRAVSLLSVVVLMSCTGKGITYPTSTETDPTATWDLDPDDTGGTEGGGEGGTDSGAEGGTDSGTEGGTDSGSEGGSDSGADGGSDSGSEGGSDSGADGGSDSGTTTLSHATDIQPIWDSACAGCHTGGGASGSLTLDDGYTSMVNVSAGELSTMDYVEPGDTSNSYLWHKISGTHASVGGSGSTMPKSGSLTSDQIATIESWILGGANP